MAPEVVKGGDAGHDFVSFDLEILIIYIVLYVYKNRRLIGGVLVFSHLNY